MSIGTKKIMLIIGGIIYAIGSIGVMYVWLFNAQFSIIETISNAIVVVGAVLFLIGLILYCHEFPVGIAFGILLVIIAFGVNGFYGFFFNTFLYPSDYSQFPSQTDGIMSVSLILMFVQAFIFAIFAFVWSFAKSESENGKKVDDQISIEKGSAFESYVDKDKKTKDVKTTKKNDVEFKF